MSNREFTVVIEPGEGSGYIAVCPTLHAVSQGATVEEAMANITAAIELVLEDLAESGEPIPEDRGVTTRTVQITG